MSEDAETADYPAYHMFYPKQLLLESTYSQSMLQKSVLQKNLQRSNIVSIDKMLAKKNLYLPAGIELKLRQKNSLVSNPSPKLKSELIKIKSKKQIEAHRKKGEYSMGQIKPIADNKQIFRIPELKQSKHHKKISVVYRIPKQMGYCLNQSTKAKSFSLKNDEKSLRYQLKVDVKKVEIKSQENDKSLVIKQKNEGNFRIRAKQKSLLEQLKNRESKSYLLRRQNVQDKGIDNVEQQLTDADFAKLSEKISDKLPKKKQSTAKFNNNKVSLWNIGKIAKKKEDEEPQVPYYNNIKKILRKDRYQEDTVEIIEPFKLKEANIFCNTAEKNLYLKKILKNKTAEFINLSIYNHEKNELNQIFTKNSNDRVQIASLTKIMTCILILNIVRIFNLDLKQERLLVNQRASKMPGTSAELTYSDTLSIYEALHALMLPSGNDAAVALAHWGGKMIRKYTSLAVKFIKSKEKDNKPFIASQLIIEKMSFQKLFIFHMNKSAKILKLKNTNFANTHGLMNERAYSTAKDIAKLTAIAMSDPIFAQIVAKKSFECSLFNRTFSQIKKIQWKNTNKLLKTEGFIGVKTGVTPSAGPCLSSMYRLNQFQSVIIIVLNVKSLQLRFKESLLLLKQYLAQNQKLRTRLKLLQKNSKDNGDQDKQEDTENANMMNNQQQPSDKEDDEEIE